MTTERVPPRIYCIPATETPIVAVFRRGPSEWSHLGCWDLQQQTYTPGSWLKGHIFPRRSALSPDGHFLSYFAHKPNATWEHGVTYVALSKLPWLHALHVFGTRGTWTRGYYFTETDHSCSPEIAKLPIPYDLAAIPVVQFANERRNSWVEAPDSPPRHPNDMWDIHRNVRLQKSQPNGDHCLYIESLGLAGGEFGREQAIDGMSVLYSLETHKDIEILDDLQWADWDQQGHLLVATRSGKLQIRDLSHPTPQVIFEKDLCVLEPQPIPPPAWAQHW